MPRKESKTAVAVALYNLHNREIWALAWARLMDADLAQDIVQESFLRLWKRWGDGEVIHNPSAWLLRVARNLAKDYAKSSFRRYGTQPPEHFNCVQGHEQTLLESISHREEAAGLADAVATLPKHWQLVLYLRDV